MHTQAQQERVLGTLHTEDNGVPIYVQLREQYLQAIGARLLNPGDQMPTMRQVAVALKVDLNTVRHAYDELERLGAIRLERGRGSFVADRPTVDAHAVKAEDLARQVLSQCAAAGVKPEAVAKELLALVRKGEGS